MGFTASQITTASIETLLASPDASTTSVPVTLPPGCESISVLLPSSFTGTVTVIGQTTGRSYPVGSVAPISGGDPLFVANTFPAVDPVVTVALSAASSASWFITSDSASRYTLGASSAGSGPPLVSGVSEIAQGVGAGATVFSASLNNVQSGQPILVLAPFQQVSEGFSINSPTNTFATPYVATALGVSSGGDAQSMGVWILTGGKGTSGSISITTQPGVYGGIVAIAFSGSSVASGTGCLDGTTLNMSQSGQTIESPSVTPLDAGSTAVFATTTFWGPSTAYGITGSPQSPFMNVLAEFPGQDGYPSYLALAIRMGTLVGTEYAIAWSAGYSYTGTLPGLSCVVNS